MRAIGKTHFGEEAAAVEVAYRLLSGKQNGPKAGTKEGRYIADRLFEGAVTLRQVEEPRADVTKIIGGAP
jgi:hypothetical protein